MTRWDRYIRVTQMAFAKYGRGGEVTISVGGIPTRYARVERFAFEWLLVRGRDVDPFNSKPN